MFDHILAISILAVVIMWLACRYSKRRAMLQKLDGVMIRKGRRIAMNANNTRNPACHLCYSRHISVCTRTGKAVCGPCGTRWVITTAELKRATSNQI